MARGRMLDQRFTQSDKLNGVSRDARLVYASILPYLDREGRTCAEQEALRTLRRAKLATQEAPGLWRPTLKGIAQQRNAA